MNQSLNIKKENKSHKLSKHPTLSGCHHQQCDIKTSFATDNASIISSNTFHVDESTKTNGIILIPYEIWLLKIAYKLFYNISIYISKLFYSPLLINL